MNGEIRMKTMEKPLISIVVPAYNVSDFLDRCIESLVNQTYLNLEIIIVDDGSKDSTSSLCDIWEKKDSRIRVIHKKNQGLGLARNTGLQYCKGKYISFVDSDDFVDKNMYETMVNILEKKDADTCYCSHNIYSNVEKKIIETAMIEEGIYAGKEILLDIIGAEPDFPKDCVRQMSVWACLFSNEIIQDYKLQFLSERDYICEDLTFDIQYLPKSKKVVVIGDAFYNYCINENSLTHKYYSNRLEKEKYLYKFMIRKLEDIYANKEYELRYNRLFLGRVRNCILQEVKDSHLSVKEVRKNIKKISSDELVRKIVCKYPINECILKQKIFNYALKLKWINIIYILALMK